MKVTLFILLIGLFVLSAYHACSSQGGVSRGAQMAEIENSPQYQDGKFRNAVEWEQPSFTEYASTTWDFLFADNQRTPAAPLPVREVDLAKFGSRQKDQLNVTWLGHSSLMISIDGYRILSDPVFAKKVSLFGPTRYNGEVPLDIERLPAIDLVLISHNHYDHLNEFSIRHLSGRTAMFIVPLGLKAALEDWDVPGDKIAELDWWDEAQVDNGLRVAATPAQHFSGRGLTDRDETLWTSWVVEAPHHRIYISGDSGYFDGFKQIGDQYGPFDMTFLECGAYDEKWRPIHMFPEETVQAHIDLRGKVLHPIHWATFNLALHAWYEPMQRLTAAADSAGVLTATPVVGETTVYGSYIPARRWWENTMARGSEK